MIWRTILLFGLILTLITSMMSILRRQPSEAYWIAYLSTPLDLRLSIMAANGSSQRVVMEGGFNAGYYWHSWSPNGRWLALTVYAYPEAIYIINPFGTMLNPIPIAPYSGDYLTWSPDSEHLAFTDEVDGQTDIFVVTIENHRVRQLTDNENEERELFWSPDGQWIYYFSEAQNLPYLARIAIDGSINERLTSPDVRPLRPVWSPDGEWLVFDAYTLAEWYELYWMRPDGSELHTIPSDLRTGVVPRSDGYYYHSSPVNDWLVFMTGNSTDFSLIRINGTGLHTVPAYGTYQYSVQWSPDGEWLIFEASENDLSNIYRLRPDGSDLENLTNNPPDSLGSGLPVVSPLVDLPFNGECLLALSSTMLIAGAGVFWRSFEWLKKRRGRFDLSYHMKTN